jgi:chemotaxis protein CheD
LERFLRRYWFIYAAQSFAKIVMASTHSANPAVAVVIEVEMGEIRISSCLTDTLVGYGLGACVGVCVYDHVLKIAGMAHIVLPERQTMQYSGGKSRPEPLPGKFADTAIPFLVEEVCRYGGDARNLRATIAGGAHIFSNGAAEGAPVSRLEIGLRNVNAVKQALEAHRIDLISTDVGGCHGRTVQMRVSDGLVTVRPIGARPAVLAVLGRDREPAPAAK